MTEPPVNTRWASGPDFAEVAEALHVPTNHIMSMQTQPDGSVLAFYTPSLPEVLTDDDEPEVFGMGFRRDADGILQPLGEPLLRPGFWKQLREQMDQMKDDQ